MAVAARRVLTETDEQLAKLFRDEVINLREERDSLAAEIDRLKLAAADIDSPEALIDAAMEILENFAETAQQADPQQLRTLLHDHIGRIEMTFTHTRRGKQVRSHLERAVVYLQPGSPLESVVTTTVRRRTGLSRLVTFAPCRRHFIDLA